MAGEEQTDSAGKYGMSGRDASDRESSPKWWPVSLKIFELVSVCFGRGVEKCICVRKSCCHLRAATGVRLHRSDRRSGQQSASGHLRQSAHGRSGLHDLWFVRHSDRRLRAGQGDPGQVSRIQQRPRPCELARVLINNYIWSLT